MIPSWAQNVLQSFGSAVFVTRRTLIPALARQKAVVRPAMPVPRTRTGKWARLRSTRRIVGGCGPDTPVRAAQAGVPAPHALDRFPSARELTRGEEEDERPADQHGHRRD